MDWHQPWLLSLEGLELEQLHDDARALAKRQLELHRFGLARAWSGLAHEVLERLLELELQLAQAGPGRPVELELGINGGAYSRD